jgi:hypothetical protein
VQPRGITCGWAVDARQRNSACRLPRCTRLAALPSHADCAVSLFWLFRRASEEGNQALYQHARPLATRVPQAARWAAAAANAAGHHRRCHRFPIPCCAPRSGLPPFLPGWVAHLARGRRLRRAVKATAAAAADRVGEAHGPCVCRLKCVRAHMSATGQGERDAAGLAGIRKGGVRAAANTPAVCCGRLPPPY